MRLRREWNCHDLVKDARGDEGAGLLLVVVMGVWPNFLV